MAQMIFTIGGQTATHDISAAHQTRLLDTFKALMAAHEAWPSDGQGGFTEPTAIQVAQWVADEWVTMQMKRAVIQYERNAAATAARAAISNIDITKA